MQRARAVAGSGSDVRQRVWYASAAHAASAAVAVPVCAAVAALTADSGLDARSAAGAALVGSLSAAAVVALRAANALSSDLKINAAFQMVTPLSVASLAVTGIDIPRVWLFWAGAAAVVVSTAAVELSGRSAATAQNARRRA